MVFIGGGLGSICRYGIARWLQSYEGNFPLATFLANALSCIVLGALVAYHLKHDMGTSIRLLLLTGFCGGFSTFSTFSYETFSLLQNGDYATALANIFFSLVVCLACVFLGMKLVA